MHDAAAGLELLWLDTLQQVTARAAHELKGALNGVSVNLEVVRGRAAQAEQPASAVARFAGSAAVQLDAVIEMNEALLALARRPRDPADVAAVLRHLAALLVPAAHAVGLPLEIDSMAEGMPMTTTAPAAAVRTVLGRCLLAAFDAGGGRLAVRTDALGVAVVLEPSSATLDVDQPTRDCAAAHGIRLAFDGRILTLTFPVASPIAPRLGAATHGLA